MVSFEQPVTELWLRLLKWKLAVDVKDVSSCQMIMNYERLLSWPRRTGNRQIGSLEGKVLDFRHPDF